MFELGMRLAFDKPTIIIKDDKTSYPFDTSPIEHLEYPRDKNYKKIVEFQVKLADKIANTYRKSIDDPSYTTFLKHFGPLKVVKLNTKEVSQMEFITDEIKTLRRDVYLLIRQNRYQSIDFSDPYNNQVEEYLLTFDNEAQADEFCGSVSTIDNNFITSLFDETDDGIIISISFGEHRIRNLTRILMNKYERVLSEDKSEHIRAYIDKHEVKYQKEAYKIFKYRIEEKPYDPF